MYFARLAENIKSGSFKAGDVDSLRFFPDNRLKAQDFGLDEKYDFQLKYSVVGSLISYIFAYLSVLSGKSIAWLSYYLTLGEKLGLKFTPPVIAISNSISICINKHTS